jgi:hypothetical protein
MVDLQKEKMFLILFLSLLLRIQDILMGKI